MQDLGLVVEMVENRFAEKEEDAVQLSEEENEVIQFHEEGEVVVRAAAEVVVRFQR